MGFKGKLNKFARWICDDCGMKILPEKIQGTLQLHCNCMAVQALGIRELNSINGPHGEEVLTVSGQKRLRVNVPSSVDRASAASRGLHDWTKPTLDRMNAARERRIVSKKTGLGP